MSGLIRRLDDWRVYTIAGLATLGFAAFHAAAGDPFFWTVSLRLAVGAVLLAAGCWDWINDINGLKEEKNAA